MARTDVTIQNSAGFVEQVTQLGADRLVDLARVFGPIFEEYMRENDYMELMDWTFGDMERVVYKIQYKALRDSESDFDPTTKVVGGTIKPEVVRIRITEEKEHAAAWYDRDFQLSNGLQTVGERIKAAIFRAPDQAIDKAIATQYGTSANANTVVPVLTLDIDAMEVTAANGQIVFEAIKTLMLAMIKSAEVNLYAEGTKFRREVLRIGISVEVEELLTAYKSSFIDQSGLLNVGIFGTRFRNIGMRTLPEITTGFHVQIFTERAVQGTFLPSIHTKFVPEAINQSNYMNELNHSFGYGLQEVFENEVTGIVQGTPIAIKEWKVKNDEGMTAARKELKETQAKNAEKMKKAQEANK